jgi:hypothetical protein
VGAGDEPPTTFSEPSFFFPKVHHTRMREIYVEIRMGAQGVFCGCGLVVCRHGRQRHRSLSIHPSIPPSPNLPMICYTTHCITPVPCRNYMFIWLPKSRRITWAIETPASSRVLPFLPYR